MDSYSTETAQVARLDERLKTMERDMAQMHVDMATMAGKVDEVLRTLQEARGGWRTLMWMSGAAASFGAALMWFLSNFQLRP
jgi:hypothetical protein